jgi:hypothetical protein
MAVIILGVLVGLPEVDLVLDIHLVTEQVMVVMVVLVVLEVLEDMGDNLVVVKQGGQVLQQFVQMEALEVLEQHLEATVVQALVVVLVYQILFLL